MYCTPHCKAKDGMAELFRANPDHFGHKGALNPLECLFSSPPVYCRGKNAAVQIIS